MASSSANLSNASVQWCTECRRWCSRSNVLHQFRIKRVWSCTFVGLHEYQWYRPRKRKKLGLRWKFKTSRPIVSCSEACSEATLSHQRAHDLGWPFALATDPFARLYKCSPRTNEYLTIWEANEYKLMLEKNILQAVCSCRSSKQGTLLLGSLAKHSSIGTCTVRKTGFWKLQDEQFRSSIDLMQHACFAHKVLQRLMINVWHSQQTQHDEKLIAASKGRKKTFSALWL